MFDNEIDWVTRLERVSRRNCREAGARREAQTLSDVYIQGRAQAIEPSQVDGSGKVFKVRRVSLGESSDCACECARLYLRRII